MRLPTRSSSSLPSPRRAGFTLVETLTTLTVLAVLIGTVFYALHVGRERAERTALASDISLLAQAQESYYGAAGSYAPTLEVLGFNPTLRTRVLGMMALPHRMVALAERDGTPALCGVLLSRQAANGTPQKVICAEGDPLGSPGIAQMGGIVEFDASTLLLTLTSRSPWGPTPAWAAVDVEFVGWAFGDGQGRIGTPDEAMRVTHAYQGDPTGRDVRVALWLRDGRMLQGGITLAPIGDPDKEGVPQAAFTISPAGDLRVGMEITLNGGASIDPDGRIAAYQWMVGSTPLSGAVTRLRLEQSGTLPVRLVVTDNDGQQGASERVLAIAPVADTSRSPTAQWTGSPLPAVAGRPVTFDAAVSTDPSGRLVRYIWKFTGGTPRVAGTTSPAAGGTAGDVLSPGQTSGDLQVEGRRVTIVWPVQGTSYVTLTVVSSTGQQHTSQSVVGVLPASTPPSLEILPGQAVVRAGQALSFSTTLTGTPTGAIDWNMGDGTVLSGSAVSHRFLVPGTYTVRAVARTNTSGSGAGTATVQVLPNLLPNAAFRVEPDPPMIGIPVTFDGTGSTDPDGEIVLHRWLWSDGVYQVGPIAERTFATPGTFMVSLTVQDDGRGQHTISVPVTVGSAPIASFTAPDPLQAGQPMPFDASASQDPAGSPILAYVWVWPDGSVDSASTPTISKTFPAATGASVTVTLRVRTATDVGSVTRTLTLNRPPVAQFTPTPLRVGITTDITLDNTSTDPDGDAMTARWTMPSGADLTDWSPTYRFSSTGGQSVTLTVQDGRGGEATVTRSDVIVVGAPTSQITPPPGGLIAGSNVTLSGAGSAADTTNGSAIVRYLWTLNGVADSSATPTIPFTVPANGDVTITLRVRDDLGQLSAPDVLTITPRAPNPPTAILLLPDGVAPNVPILGDARDSYADSAAGATLVTYRWDLGDGRTSDGATPTLSMQWGTPGDYLVTLVVVDDAGRASAPDSVTVTVSNALRAQFTVNPAGGPGGTTFTMQSTTTHPDGLPLSYRWLMNGATVGAGAPTTTVRPPARGTYALQLIAWDQVGRVDTSATQNIAVQGRAPIVAVLGGPAVRTRLEGSGFSLSVAPTDGDPVLATGWQAFVGGDWIAVVAGASTVSGFSATTGSGSLLLDGGLVGQILQIRGWAEDTDGVNVSDPVTLEVVNLPPVCGAITSPDSGMTGGSITQQSAAQLTIACADPENDTPLTYTWSAPAVGVGGADATWATNMEGIGSVVSISVTVRDALGAATTVTQSFQVVLNGALPPIMSSCMHTPTSDFILPSGNGGWVTSAGCFEGGRQSAGRYVGGWAEPPAQGAQIGDVAMSPLGDAVTLIHPSAPGTYYLYGTFVSAAPPLVTNTTHSAPVCVLGPPTDGMIEGAISRPYWYGGKRYMTMVASWVAAPCGEEVELLTGPTLDPLDPAWEVHDQQPATLVKGYWDIQVYPFIGAGAGWDGNTRTVAIGVRTTGGSVRSAILPLDMTIDYDDEWLVPPPLDGGLYLQWEHFCGIATGRCVEDVAGTTLRIGALEAITIWGTVPGAMNLTMEWTDITGGLSRPLTSGPMVDWTCDGDSGLNELQVTARYSPMADLTNQRTIVLGINCVSSSIQLLP